jgi:hypothetical protein
MLKRRKEQAENENRGVWAGNANEVCGKFWKGKVGARDQLDMHRRTYVAKRFGGVAKRWATLTGKPPP